MMKIVIILNAIIAFLSAQSVKGSGRIFPQWSATVSLQPGTVAENGIPVTGTLEINDFGFGVYISGEVRGLRPGLHGFHVHEKGLLTNECKDAGGHFNPLKRPHGDPRDYHRHVGDLGNIEADAEGIARINIMDREASLDPLDHGYIGQLSIVIHADEDDVGLGGDQESLRTGNAGPRRACGKIVPQRNILHSIIKATVPSAYEDEVYHHPAPVKQQEQHPIVFKGEGYRYSSPPVKQRQLVYKVDKDYNEYVGHYDVQPTYGYY